MEALAKFAIVALLVFAVIGNGPNVANANICGITIDQLMTCKSAVESPDSIPSADCCSALKKVHPPTCLCQYQSSLAAFGIDKNLAMQIPEKCQLDNAKSFHCPS
ncbi:hypothetical protein M9H77_35141 [Catharanthus roseus]|uniref:Uncharacterized protein n=1 Tax=Catharanthus roseus TaxID=4058 RepID=A0ACB9ZQQ7_CATRO|nr:hypothetical protein M9H77_35141 [Catharanthus roseus]